MELKFLTKSPYQTQRSGKTLSIEIIRVGLGKRAVVIALIGDLGGGKTTFVQGLAAGLGVSERVLSPTFVILKSFEIGKRFATFKRLYHIDCYRIDRDRDLLGLGFKEIISKPENIVVIEWADKIKGLLPRNSLFLHFIFIDKTTRKIVLQ